MLKLYYILGLCCIQLPLGDLVLDGILIEACLPSPCGPNSECREIQGNAVCSCLRGFLGKPPYCGTQCSGHYECAATDVCVNKQCKHPCPGACGVNAICEVINHLTVCSCSSEDIGDPFVECLEPFTNESDNNCKPSPCGPNSRCREINGVAACSCLPGYIGKPPLCLPMCIDHKDCSEVQACIKNKCISPCPTACGLNSICQTVNHIPVCSCPPDSTGNAFVECFKVQNKSANDSCLPGLKGLAPSCSNCSANTDCAETEACVFNKCIDPCPGLCGEDAECGVKEHVPFCFCKPGYSGNVFLKCDVIQTKDEAANTSCLPGFKGFPPSCPNCTTNTDCAEKEACVFKKCVDPCPGLCGEDADCGVKEHVPYCFCKPGYTGNAYRKCDVIEVKDESSNTSCLPGFKGLPPSCPNCTNNTECAETQACVLKKCIDPCPGLCGEDAKCGVKEHVPYCFCKAGYTGNAYRKCDVMQVKNETVNNSCNVTRCGPNSQCKVINNEEICSCLPGFEGTPPSCNSNCTANTDCAETQTCVFKKCVDPCLGVCGKDAECGVKKHVPFCFCKPGYSGDAYVKCDVIEVKSKQEN